MPFVEWIYFQIFGRKEKISVGKYRVLISRLCCILLKNQKNHWLNDSQEKMSHELKKTTIIFQVF